MGWLLQVDPTLVKLEHRQRHVKAQQDPEQENKKQWIVGGLDKTYIDPFHVSFLPYSHGGRREGLSCCGRGGEWASWLRDVYGATTPTQ